MFMVHGPQVRIVGIALFMLSLAVVPSYAQLQNGSLDAFTGNVATGWQSFVLSAPQGPPAFLAEVGFWRRTKDNPNQRAQRFWSDGGSYDAGIYQQVTVTPGRTYRFCCWMNNYSADSAVVRTFYAGLDPNGGSNPLQATWSAPVSWTGEYLQVCIEGVATGATLTVFARGVVSGGVFGERSTFVDDASLEEIGGGCASDLDGDGVCDEQEGPNIGLPAGKSNIILDDSDGDRLLDGQEDTNRNGTQDAGETSTRDSDSDDDRFEDGLERLLSTNPLSPNAGFADADGDGLPDAQDPNDASKDSDGDRYDDLYDVLWNNSLVNMSQVPRLGDANGDTFVTSLDALIIQSLFLGIIDPNNPVFDQGGPDYNGFRLTDANRDGFVTSLDALIIQSFFLQILPTLPLR